MRLPVIACIVASCGGSTAPATGPSPPPPPQNAVSATATATAATVESAPYDDPDESDGPIALKPLLASGRKPSFPKATVGEHECWQTVSPTGEARKDYEAIVAKCGAATGAIEYVKPAHGKLHETLDKRDTFVVPIRGGLCYRFFGVADSTIKDIDILIERPGGALVGDDKTTGPVAIIESEKAWCMDKDGVYNFLVEIDGHGQGNYVFGAWARPKP